MVVHVGDKAYSNGKWASMSTDQQEAARFKFGAVAKLKDGTYRPIVAIGCTNLLGQDAVRISTEVLENKFTECLENTKTYAKRVFGEPFVITKRPGYAGIRHYLSEVEIITTEGL